LVAICLAKYVAKIKVIIIVVKAEFAKS